MRKPSEHSEDMTVVLACIAIALYLLAPLIWKLVAHKLTVPLSYWASAQLHVAPYLVSDAYEIALDLRNLRRQGEILSYEGLRQMLSTAGRYTAVPLMGVLALLLLKAWAIPRWPQNTKLRFSAQDLIDHQARFWAASAPLRGMNLEDPALAKHPYARRALTPAEWALKHRAVRDSKLVMYRNGEVEHFDESAPANATGVQRTIPLERVGNELLRLVSCKFDPQNAELAFLKQLGKKFEGYEQMPAHYFGVVCYCLAHIGPDRQREWELQYELIDRKGKPGPIAWAIWDENKSLELLARVGRRHRWDATVVRALFAESKRLGGKVEAWWVWLKAVDYALYINLNEDGRMVAWVESAGVRAQYEAEVTLADMNEQEARSGGEPLMLEFPSVQPAVVALKDYLDQTGALTGEATLLQET